MWVKNLYLKNFKSYKNLEGLKFTKGLNILIGPNNAGKSAIIRAIYALQNPELIVKDTRVNMGAEHLEINIELGEPDKKYIPDFQDKHEPYVYIKVQNNSPNAVLKNRQGYGDGGIRFDRIPNTEPDNFIYPFLSNRKVAAYAETVAESATKSITGNFQHLHAKIDRISNPLHLAHGEFQAECEKILGSRFSAINSENGKKAGFPVDNFSSIAIDKMGDGVPNILGLLADLCIAKEKLFLIEEPENDIHPKALKGLLELILKKAKDNQFIITTHSNIVLRYLCTGNIDCKIFSFNMKRGDDNIPNSTVKEIGNTPGERMKVLEELGYEFLDFESWEAYLILEEASAESIIRDFLIPTFIPTLTGKLRTIASNGIDNVEPRFIDFHRLFVFIHLAPQYKDKAWVLVDGDEKGKKVIESLRNAFSTWSNEHFNIFNKQKFEDYYPPRFREDIDKVFSLPADLKRVKAKGDLAKKIIDWTISEPDNARREFAESAEEVIDFLKAINASLGSRKHSSM